MKSKGFLCAFVVGFLLTASILQAQTQQTGQSGTGSTSSGAANTGNTGTATNKPATPINTPSKNDSGLPTPGANNQRLPQRPQIFTITGSVILEDGTPPPMGTVIERECGGRKTREASVSPNGTFEFQVGGSSITNLLPDASDNISILPVESGRTSSMGFPDGLTNPSASILGCELRAQLGGYRSSAVILTSNPTIGIMDVGTIVLYPAERVRGTSVSVTSLAAPKAAQKALGKAEKAFQKKKLDEAEKNAQEALRLYSAYAAAWYQLGQVYVQSKRIEEAKSVYAKAMNADPNYVSPYIELARLAGAEGKWEETVRLTDQALDLDPLDYPYGYYMNAVANFSLGRLDAAEKSVLKLNRLDPLHRWPQTFLVMASILHSRQDYAGEIVQLRAYLKYAPASADTSKIRSRISVLEKGGVS